MESTVAIVLAAGSGVRVGRTVNKIHLSVGDAPVIARSARAFRDHPEVDELYVVAAPAELELCRETLEVAGIVADDVIAGGATRHASELAALERLAARIECGEIGTVLIHDAARPLVDDDTISVTIAAARQHGGAVAALPVERPLAVVHDGVVVGRREPTRLWRAQTPQAFAARPLLDSYRRALAEGFEGSDTAMSLERTSTHVQVVQGHERNLKITYPLDLVRAEVVLENSKDACA